MRMNQVWNEVVGDDVAADIRSALKALKVLLLAVIGLLVGVACGATCHPTQRAAPFMNSHCAALANVMFSLFPRNAQGAESEADKRYVAWCYTTSASGSGPQPLSNFQFDPAVGSSSIRLSSDGRKVRA